MSMSGNSKFCSICRQKFLLSSLYSCYNNHYFCKDCFKQEFYTVAGGPKRCPHRYCESWVCTSGQPLTLGIHGDQRKPRKMFPSPIDISLDKAESAEENSLSYLYNLSVTSLAALSKKPVSCPFKNCNKSIAVSAFDAHFKYEHKNVIVINTYLEHRNGLHVSPDDVVYNENICFVLINLLNEEKQSAEARLFEMRCREQGLLFSKPLFVVLATRFSASTLEDSDDEDEDIVVDQYSCSPDDKIIMWAASTVTTNYSYTLAISTLCHGIRIKYYGPVHSLNEDAKKLCNEGRCLILSRNHFLGMSENGQNALAVDIIIHGKDDT